MGASGVGGGRGGGKGGEGGGGGSWEKSASQIQLNFHYAASDQSSKIMV